LSSARDKNNVVNRITNRKEADGKIGGFVAGIRAYARKFDPDLLVFPQNSPELAALASGYLNSVDGIGQDNIYFGYY